MKTKLFLSAIVFFMVLTAQAQEVNEHYIEVTGTSEIEIMPDKIHYIIEIREYFEEEFDGKSKPEEYWQMFHKWRKIKWQVIANLAEQQTREKP